MDDKIKFFAIAAGALLVGVIMGFIFKGPSDNTASTPPANVQTQPGTTGQMPPGAGQMPSGHPSVGGQENGNQPPAEPINMDNIIGRIEAFCDEKYPGAWRVEGNKLYKGDYLENDNFKIADEIGKLLGSGSMISIFVGEERISTTVVQTGAGRVLQGYPTPPEVAECLKTGKEIDGGSSSMGSSNYVKAFIPFKDKDGKAVAVMSVVVMQ